jgi:hypothetical protein
MRGGGGRRRGGAGREPKSIRLIYIVCYILLEVPGGVQGADEGVGEEEVGEGEEEQGEN